MASLLSALEPARRRRVSAFPRLGVLAALLACAGAAALAQTTRTLTEDDLLGLTRIDVVRSLGKPQSTARRGDKEILLFSSGARVELRGDEVISFQGSPTAVITAADGTRYLPGADGNIQRADGQSLVEVRRRETPPGPPAELPASENPGADEAPIPEALAEPSIDPAGPDGAPAAQLAEEGGGLTTAPALDQKIPGTKVTVENYLETGHLLPGEEEKPPAWVTVASEAVGMGLRFVLVIVILGLAIRWVGLPFYWPDLIKVSALYVAVREVMHGLGGFGGLWEFIRIFRVEEGIGYLAMMFFLYKFGVCREGITALKIATATKIVTYFLMMILMLAVSFILLGLK